jgi:hypothetical protein
LALLKEGWKYAQNLRKKDIGMIYGPINDNDIWKTRYNNEPSPLNHEPGHS